MTNNEAGRTRYYLMNSVTLPSFYTDRTGLESLPKLTRKALRLLFHDEELWRVLAAEGWMAWLEADRGGCIRLLENIQSYEVRLRTLANSTNVTHREANRWRSRLERYEDSWCPRTVFPSGMNERKRHDGVLLWLSAWHAAHTPKVNLENLFFRNRRAALREILSQGSVHTHEFLSKHGPAVLKFLRKYQFASNAVHDFKQIALETSLLIHTLRHHPEIALELRHQPVIHIGTIATSAAGSAAYIALFRSLMGACQDAWHRNRSDSGEVDVASAVTHPLLDILIPRGEDASMPQLLLSECFLNHARLQPLVEVLHEDDDFGVALSPLKLLAESRIETLAVTEVNADGTFAFDSLSPRGEADSPSISSLSTLIPQTQNEIAPGDVVVVRKLAIGLTYDLVLPENMTAIQPATIDIDRMHRLEHFRRLSRGARGTAGRVARGALPLLERVAPPAGLVLEPLLTVDSLRREGSEQQHCLASTPYHYRLKAGTSQFFRVLGPERATLEIRYASPAWEVVDLSCRKNAKPCASTQSLVNEWIEAINTRCLDQTDDPHG